MTEENIQRALARIAISKLNVPQSY